MKINYTLLLLFLLATVSILAQTPEKMSYQVVLRDASNTLLTNQQVGIQISILQTTITGSAVYTEIQTATTNINGLVSLEIGTGTSSNNFSAIDWSTGPFFIKTATDPSGGSNYSIIGTSQLMSVPFALYAKTAESVLNSTWTTSGSDIYNSNTGNVGIGTTTPSAKLDVNGNSIIGSTSGTFNERLLIGDVFGNNWAGIVHNDIGKSSNYALMQNRLGRTVLNASSAQWISFNISSAEKMRMDANGNLGIGTSAPSAKLDVAGTVKIVDGTEGAGKVLTSDGDGLASWADAATGTDNQTAAEVPSTITGSIEATNVDAAIAELEAEKAPLASPTFTGNVTASSLVHSSDPAYNYIRFVGNNDTQLAGSGFLRLKVDEADKLFVRSSHMVSTVDLGVGHPTTYIPTAKLDVAGTVKIVDGTEGAGKVLTSDADGLASWADAATGTDNQTAAEVPSTITGSIEATNVDAAIAELEAEKAPLASPAFTGNVVMDSNLNVAADMNLGGNLFGGNLFTNGGLFLNSWDVYTNPGIFSINESNVASHFNIIPGGNVGIGNTNPTAKLDVAGTVKIVDGSQGVGKVLTSDADGLASWAAAAISVTEVDDEFTATASQTAFILSQVPSANSKVKMYVNGIRISKTAYTYTSSGTSLTYNPANNAGYALTAGDRIQFDYFY
jgi:hypothetical protein